MRTDRRKMIRQSILPASYERLEYIENTSTAYIDCGLKPKYTFDYEIKTNVKTEYLIFGCKLTNFQSPFRFFWYGDSLYFDVGTKRTNIKIPDYTHVKIIHAKFGNYFIENLSNKEKVTNNIFNENMNNAKISNLLIFEGRPNIKGKIWLLNINDNGKPIRKFIPAKHKSDGVIGMYDLVGRKFYTSSNGVAFTGG